MIKLSIILIAGTFLAFSSQNLFTIGNFNYKIKASNGGPNGFNSVNSSCNPFTNKYFGEYKDSGYEKFEFICFSDLPESAKDIILKIKPLILEGKDTIGQLKIKEYTGKFNISDKFNFEVDISNQ